MNIGKIASASAPVSASAAHLAFVQWRGVDRYESEGWKQHSIGNINYTYMFVYYTPYILRIIHGRWPIAAFSFSLSRIDKMSTTIDKHFSHWFVFVWYLFWFFFSRFVSFFRLLFAFKRFYSFPHQPSSGNGEISLNKNHWRNEEKKIMQANANFVCAHLWFEWMCLGLGCWRHSIVTMNIDVLCMNIEHFNSDKKSLTLYWKQ